jgi:hypothetical protein
MAKKQVVKGKKKKAVVENKSGSFLDRWGAIIILVFSAIITFQARLHLLAIPMERDEAGFAYIGHGLLHGLRLYVDMVDNKLPGLYMLYGLFTTWFGYSSTGVHLGLLLANLVSAVCFYFLLRQLYNRFIASIGTAFFIIMLVSSGVLGFAAHATQLLLPFALGGFLIFWKGILSGRKIIFFIAGLLLGFAFIIKQQSIVFGVLAAILWWPIRLSWQKKQNEKLPVLEWLYLGAGGLLPVAMVIAYFILTGRGDDLYFWSVRQPAGMQGTFINTSTELFRIFFPMVIKHLEIIWFGAGIGIVLIFISAFQKSAVWFGLLLALMGLGSVVIGAAYYQHYFILALPGIALLAAVTVYWISIRAGKAGIPISLGIAFIMLTWFAVSEREYLFHPDYNKIHQAFYNNNMFPELERIGHELSKLVPAGGKIGIMGSEPEVLVAANRETCTRHLFMYPLLSDPVLSPPLQTEYVAEMKACAPEYIVWNSGSGSWTSGYDQLQMFEQLLAWVEANYTPVGLAEFRPNAPGELVWGEALQSHQSQNDFKIYVFRKK